MARNNKAFPGTIPTIPNTSNQNNRITLFPGGKYPPVPEFPTVQKQNKVTPNSPVQDKSSPEPETNAKCNYQEFMKLDQAGPANIAFDNTRRPVAIKRLQVTNLGSVPEIPNFTSDHVVNIKQSYMDRGDMVIIYEQMDISLRDMTGVLTKKPLQDTHIAVICKDVSILLYTT